MAQKVLPFMRPNELAVAHAFSIISKERTLDFIAPNQAERNTWLSNLQMLLVNRATQDTAKVMGRDDVNTELRAMSFAISKLARRVTAARVTLDKLPTLYSVRSSNMLRKSMALEPLKEDSWSHPKPLTQHIESSGNI